jgi:hypothetical protein
MTNASNGHRAPPPTSRRAKKIIKEEAHDPTSGDIQAILIVAAIQKMASPKQEKHVDGSLLLNI